jgi:hypothetical protein
MKPGRCVNASYFLRRDRTSIVIPANVLFGGQNWNARGIGRRIAGDDDGAQEIPVHCRSRAGQVRAERPGREWPGRLRPDVDAGRARAARAVAEPPTPAHGGGGRRGRSAPVPDGSRRAPGGQDKHRSAEDGGGRGGTARRRSPACSKRPPAHRVLTRPIRRRPRYGCP